MKSKTETLSIAYYVDLIFRNRWLVIIPFCLSMIAGIYLALTLPKIYQASTVILVMPQRVPKDYVRSVVSTDIGTRITTISKQILSRTNLENIIQAFNLFSNPGQENLFMEDKVANLLNRIDVNVSRSRSGKDADAFSISFKSPDPLEAMKVANGLANRFIEENLKVREAQATGTSDFLDEELDAMRKRLEVVEDRLKEYRKRYMGELPDQLETNLRVLDRLQSQLNFRQESLRNAKNRLVILEGQIKAGENSEILGSPGDETLNLFQLKEQLINLKTKYTDRHPDVIRLKNQIEELEKTVDISEATAAPTSPGSKLGKQDNVRAYRVNPELERNRKEITWEIQAIESDIERIDRQIEEYQRRVEATPKREQELISLQRDYQNIQESYRSLLNRRLEAQIAVNMEKKQKGEQFNILDRASLPRSPISPDMRRLFFLSLAFGLGVGGGLIFLRDFLDTTFRRADDLESNLAIPVLAIIPKVYHRRDIRLRRLNQAGTTLAVSVALVLCFGFAALVFNGVESTFAAVRHLVNI
ncbi:MAG: protein GumC [Desulfobacterales bacterium]|nr:MAG: protein GumC [Desulfobacterales bacterium]